MLIALLGEGHATWILIDKCEPTPLAFCETGASDYIEYLEDVLRTKDLAIGCIQGKLFDIFCLVIVLAFLSFFGFSIFASLCFPVFYPKKGSFLHPFSAPARMLQDVRLGPGSLFGMSEAMVIEGHPQQGHSLQLLLMNNWGVDLQLLFTNQVGGCNPQSQIHRCISYNITKWVILIDFNLNDLKK